MTKMTVDVAETPDPNMGPGIDTGSDHEERQVELPMQTRQVRMLPETADAEARRIEVVWSTGAMVRRRDWLTGKRYDESLSLESSHVDLSRLNGGAPLLNSHGAFDLDKVIGVVENAWIDEASGEGRAQVRFSERDGVTAIWNDVETGILRNISVGYQVRSYEITEEDGKPPLWRAVDWQPMELSAVPVGADPHAGFRANNEQTHPCQLITPAPVREKEGISHMDENETVERIDETPEATHQDDADAMARATETLTPEPVQATAAPVDTAEVAEQAVAAERLRISGIYEAQGKLGIERAVADGLVARGVSLDDARGVLIDRAADQDRVVETRTQISMGGQDERQTRFSAVEDALLHRFEPGRYQLSDPAREWRGYSLIELARSFLESEGERVRGISRDEIATRALHSTSDFPEILAAVTNKTLRDAYEAAPRTYQPIARRTSASDFKDINRLQLGEAPQLEKVNESGEFKRGTMGEAKERYRVETYGKVMAITRQVIINDDLDAFTRVPSLFGTSAATLESDVVWGIITDNPAMNDGTALFNANHKNLAASGTALDVANLGKARTAMAKQTGLDGKTILNVRPIMLVVPSSLELTAEQLISQNLVPAKSADVVPGSIRSLGVITEPRLDPASGAVPWYLFASPAAIDTLEYAYLDGQDGVFIETRNGFDVDGIEIKARLDFGAKAIDWRGIHKNPGV
jgi:phage major head subunit gpT-like protein